MIQLSCHLRFLPKSLQEDRISREFSMQHLQGNPPIQRGVQSLVDGTKTTLAKKGDFSIFSEGFGKVGSHGTFPLKVFVQIPECNARNG